MEHRKKSSIDFQQVFNESQTYLDYSDKKFKESQERMQHTVEVLNERLEQAERKENSPWFKRFAIKLGLA